MSGLQRTPMSFKEARAAVRKAAGPQDSWWDKVKAVVVLMWTG